VDGGIGRNARDRWVRLDRPGRVRRSLRELVDGESAEESDAGVVDEHEPLVEAYLTRLNGIEEEHKCHQKM
jgi:hypothetical protein